MIEFGDLEKALEEAKRKQREHFATQGAGYNPYNDSVDACIQALRDAKIDHIVKNLDDYRARWNAEVAKYMTPKGIRSSDMRKVEDAMGCTLRDINVAKEISGAA